MPVDRFPEDVAQRYDDDCAEMFDAAVVEPAVAFLAELAGDGPVLELGIGTGRIALPLRDRGITVHGVDLSTAMVERLHAKRGGEGIEVTIGDFATVDLGKTFALAYLVFNTIGNLTSQDEQVACFENVSRHLDSGGHFVIETGVPGLQRVLPGERFVPFSVTPTHVGIDEYDIVNQGLVSHHYYVRESSVTSGSIPLRYVWPSELDLMARIAGMRLRERFGDWDKRPFTDESTKHVSVWTKT
ncbi:MAG TPA: methyltransferase domain-containing protein [Gaiellaceae bacterium]